MPYTTLVAGTTITASWANGSVRDQAVTPFATASTRSSAITSPVTGMLSHRADLPGFEGYDGTGWAIAGLYQVLARKTSDETITSSTTLQNDDQLLWAVRASGVYSFDLWVLYSSGTTPDFKIGWTVPASATMKWGFFGNDTALVFTNASGYTESSAVAAGGSGGDLWMYVHGVITVSGTAGNVQFQWAQNTSDPGSTIVRTGSYGLLTRLA